MSKTHKDSFGKRDLPAMTRKERKNNREQNMLRNPRFIEEDEDNDDTDLMCFPSTQDPDDE